MDAENREILNELSKKLNDIFEPKIKNGGVVFASEVAECIETVLGYRSPIESCVTGWVFDKKDNLYLTEVY